jgi:segregation and condensation protein B
MEARPRDEILPGNLGRTYAALLEQQTWEVDAEETMTNTPAGSLPVQESGTPPPLNRIIEALLFVGGPPLTAERAGETVRGLTPIQFIEAVDALNCDYRHQNRPYAIRAQGDGFVLGLRPRFRSLVDNLYGTPREARLSPAAVDVLALVAYRQPVTKPEVDGLRGVESGALLRQLIRRGLIAVSHRGEAGQREVSYGTTSRFLELFGLKDLDDLPQTQDLQLL